MIARRRSLRLVATLIAFIVAAEAPGLPAYAIVSRVTLDAASLKTSGAVVPSAPLLQPAALTTLALPSIAAAPIESVPGVVENVVGAAPLSTLSAGIDDVPGTTATDEGRTKFDGAEPNPAPGGKTKLPKGIWGLFWGHSVLTVFGIEFHVVSQPFLVKKTLGRGAATMGLVRNVHMGSMGLANLLPAGLLVDRTNLLSIFVVTSVARAALMGAIPLLFLAGHLSIGVLVAIVAMNPLFQNTMLVADGAAEKALLGKDEKLNKEAAATLGKWNSLVGVITPIVAALGVSALVAHFGVGGYALAYGVYASLVAASIPVYWFTFRDPRDPKTLGPGGFKEFLKSTVSLVGVIAKGLVMSPILLYRLIKEIRSAATDPSTVSAGKIRERIAAALEGHSATAGIAYILRNRLLSILMLVGSVEAFLSDAMPMVVLPNFIEDVIGTGPALNVPWVGDILTTGGGIFGLILAVEALGHFFASWMMEGDRGDRMIDKFGPGRFYRVAAVASLLFWLMWAVPTFAHTFALSLGTVLAVTLVMHFFHGPVGIVMAPVWRREMDDTKLGRIESAFYMVEMLFSSLGALAAGLLLDFMSIKAAMFAIAVSVTLTAVLEWQVPKWIFPDGIRPAKKSPEPPTQARVDLRRLAFA